MMNVDFMGFLKAYYLRLECPSFTRSYDFAVMEARAQEMDILSATTARRRLDAEVPRSAQDRARHGRGASS